MISICYQCKEAKEIKTVAPFGNKYCDDCWTAISQFMLFIEVPRNLQIAVNCVRQLYIAKGYNLPEMEVTK